MGQDSAGMRKKVLDGRDTLDRIKRWLSSLGVVVRGQFIDLLDVEDGIALHERDGALGIFAGLFICLGLRDLIGIDHKRAFFAFADMAAKLAGLAEGHPDRRGVSGGFGFHPKHEHVDPGIGLAVVATRTGDPACRVFGVPGF